MKKSKRTTLAAVAALTVSLLLLLCACADAPAQKQKPADTGTAAEPPKTTGEIKPPPSQPETAPAASEPAPTEQQTVPAESEGEKFSIVVHEPENGDYSYLRCDVYLGDTLFTTQYGCPDEGDDFTHFDCTPEVFQGIEGDHSLSEFRAELFVGKNGYSKEEALMQAMMGNVGDSVPLSTLQFTPEFGRQYEYRLVPEGESYSLEKVD